MPSMRVIVGGAIGCLFICGLFGGQAVAQTASTEPVGKPIQLLQLTHPGKPEAKPHERAGSTDGDAIRSALEDLKTPYEGLIRPFTAENHDALGPTTTSWSTTRATRSFR